MTTKFDFFFFFNSSFDSRGKPLKDGKHWANEDILTGRAFFRANDEPARLMIENVKEQDGGVYRCRVDFKKSPTKNTKVNLTVISKLFFISFNKSLGKATKGKLFFEVELFFLEEWGGRKESLCSVDRRSVTNNKVWFVWGKQP